MRGLSFGRLRVANVQRCTSNKGFNHSLASWSPLEWAGAMAGESGEACNVAKKMLRFRDGVRGNMAEDRDLAHLRERLGAELADTVIYADLVAASQGIDLSDAIRKAWNKKSEEIGYPERI